MKDSFKCFSALPMKKLEGIQYHKKIRGKNKDHKNIAQGSLSRFTTQK